MDFLEVQEVVEDNTVETLVDQETYHQQAHLKEIQEGLQIQTAAVEAAALEDQVRQDLLMADLEVAELLIVLMDLLSQEVAEEDLE